MSFARKDKVRILRPESYWFNQIGEIENLLFNHHKLLIKKPLNAVYGSAVYWLSDSEGLIVKTIIENRGNVPAKSAVPDGPIIQEN